MQIKFKTGYSIGTPLSYVQAGLLNIWYKSLEASQIKFIKKANIEFIDYDLCEYPNQDKLKEELTSYYNSFNTKQSEHLSEKAFNNLIGKLRILELVITPEDNSE